MNRQEPTAPRVPWDANDVGGGAMTGATGSLTPDDGDDSFVPAETREFNVPPGEADVTTALRGASEATHAPERPLRESPVDEPSAPNDRDGGYGTRHGMGGRDAAYRVERRAAPELPRPEGAERRMTPEQDRF